MANVVLLVALVPSLGIAGAGIALCGAYLVMLAVMHGLTRRAFIVRFEWRRLAQLAVVLGALTVAGTLLLPANGFVGFITRLGVFLAMPVILWFTGFALPGESQRIRRLASRLWHARTVRETA